MKQERVDFLKMVGEQLKVAPGKLRDRPRLLTPEIVKANQGFTGSNPKEGAMNRAAQTVITHAQNSSDALSFVEALAFGADLMIRDKKFRDYGQDILDNLENYLVQHPIATFRTITPSIKKEVSQEEHMQGLLPVTIARLLGQVKIPGVEMPQVPSSLEFLFMLFSRDLGEEVQDSLAALTSLQSRKQKSETPEKFLQAENYYHEIYKNLQLLKTGRKKGELADLEAIGKVVDWGLGMEDGITAFPSILTRVSNKTTFAQVFSEQNPAVMALSLMQYVQGFEKNDVFWQTFISEILFMKQANINLSVSGQEQFGEYAGLIDRFFDAQLIMAEKLILPIIDPQTYARDEGFDKLFSEMLTALPHDTTRSLAEMIHFAIAESHTIRHIFPQEKTSHDDPLIAFLNTIMSRPISRLALHEYEQVHGKSMSTLSFDNIFQEFLFRHEQEILSSWQTHFPGSDTLRDVFKKEIHYTLQERSKKELLVTLKNNLGEKYLASLEGQAEDIKKVNRQMWQQALGPRLSYWPNPEVITQVRVAKNSFADVVGIEEIGYIAKDPGFHKKIDIHDPVVSVYIEFGEGYGLTGDLDLEGNLINVSVPDLEPGLLNMFEQEVIRRFAALVTRNDIKKRKRDTKPKAPKGQIEEQTIMEEIQPDQTPKKQRPYERPLPRFLQEQEEGTTEGITEVVTDEELKDTISQERPRATSERRASGQRAPITTHVKRLSGVKAFIYAGEAFKHAFASNDQQRIADARAALNDAREKMYIISKKKQQDLETLSPRLKDRIQIFDEPDPEYENEKYPFRNEQNRPIYYGSTWAVAKELAKLYEESKGSILGMYVRKYRETKQQPEALIAFDDILLAQWVLSQSSGFTEEQEGVEK